MWNSGAPAKRIKLENLSDFTMHPHSRLVAAFIAGKKSEPSAIRLFKYPNVDVVVASKSFFNADRVEFKWNKSGNNLLLHCSTETSANSYYGDSTLHQITNNGESQIIQLSKYSLLNQCLVFFFLDFPHNIQLFRRQERSDLRARLESGKRWVCCRLRK